MQFVPISFEIDSGNACILISFLIRILIAFLIHDHLSLKIQVPTCNLLITEPYIIKESGRWKKFQCKTHEFISYCF
jgi:hypothetical protein